MDLATKRAAKRKLFYGWWIVLAASVGNALQAGTFFYGFSNFFNPLINEFGWSRASLSAVASLSRLEGGVAAPVVGFLVDRFGPRRMMFGGMSLMGLSYILMARIHSFATFTLTFVFLSLGSSFGTALAFYAAVGNWFIKKRGRAFGLVNVGAGLGGFVLVPSLALLIERFGWRMAATMAGVVLGVVGTSAALAMRHKPEPYGYAPDNEVEDEKRETQNPPQIYEVKEADFTAREALGTAAFWLVATSVTLASVAYSATVLHQIPFLVSIGIPAQMAAFALGLMTLVSIPGRFGFGWLADLIAKRWVLAICYGLQALSLFLLSGASQIWEVLPALFLYGPSYGGSIVVRHALRGAYFGRRAFASIQGLMEAITVSGSVLGPIFAGYVFDVTQSYRLAFTAFAFANIAAALIILAAKPPRAEPT